MTFKSKRTLTSTVTGFLLIGAYIIYALGTGAPGAEDVKGWAMVMLVFIGIGIAAEVLIQIFFHMGFAISTAVRERREGDEKVERMIASAVVEDELDKMITLKASRITLVFTGVGCVMLLAALALGVAVVPALHIVAGACALGSVAEGAISIYWYERGM